MRLRFGDALAEVEGVLWDVHVGRLGADALRTLVTPHKGPLVQLFYQPVLVLVQPLGLLLRRISRKSHSVAAGNVKPDDVVCIFIGHSDLLCCFSLR